MELTSWEKNILWYNLCIVIIWFHPLSRDELQKLGPSRPLHQTFQRKNRRTGHKSFDSPCVEDYPKQSKTLLWRALGILSNASWRHESHDMTSSVFLTNLAMSQSKILGGGRPRLGINLVHFFMQSTKQKQKNKSTHCAFCRKNCINSNIKWFCHFTLGPCIKGACSFVAFFTSLY